MKANWIEGKNSERERERERERKEVAGGMYPA